MELILIVIFIILGFKAVTLILDRKVEERSFSRYPLHDDGVVFGAGPQERSLGNPVAIIFIHGYTNTTEIFDKIIQSLPLTTDYYVPLLPFHGRGLLDMKDFSPQSIQQYLGVFIDEKERCYQKLILVGQSLGGALLTQLLLEKKWDSERVSMVLLAPALCLVNNHRVYHFFYQYYPWFRTYWASPQTTSSADVVAKKRCQAAKTFGYDVTPSIWQLYQYCNRVTRNTHLLSAPYVVFLASDDNRIQVEALKLLIEKSPRGKLVLLTGGKHLLYWSQHVDQIIKFLCDEVERHDGNEVSTSQKE